MNRRVLAVLAALALAGCGEKTQEMKNAANAMEAASKVASNLAASQGEAEKVYADRKARGDTLAMPYADLQKLLPSAPDGYKAAEEPGGSSQSMGGFSMSQAEQTFTQAAGPDGNTPSVKVTIVDLGGTQGAYAMMAAPMMMDLSQEDAHHRMKTHKMDAADSWAAEEYNKDSKEAKVSIVTRYRYMVTVEARNQGSDQSAMVMKLAEEIARKFAGK
jgi:hypothetical protein